MLSHSLLYPDNHKINWIMIGVVCLVIAISPIMALVFAILFYRQRISFPLFILFAFYFGWFYEPQLDLLNHYNHFKTLIGKTLFEAWNDSGTQRIGKEPYPVLFKYVVGTISASPNFFSACACAVYAMLFSYGVLGSIRDLYIKKKTMPAWILLIGILFIVEYNWFLGFRYWSGVFVFAAFYIRYVRTNQVKYLFLSFLCLCFHFSLLALCAAAILNYFLKNNFKIRYLFIIIGWVIRYIQIPITTYIAKLSIMDGIVKDTSRNESTIKSVAKRLEYFRTEGNQFYQIRNDILFLGTCIILIFLWRRFGRKVISYNTHLWGLILILYALANIGYASLIFYDRFYKVTLLFLYIYLFIIFIQMQNRIDVNNRILISALVLMPILYGIATIAISQRAYLWEITLWFNNFLF